MTQIKDNQMLIQPNTLVNAEYDLTKHESNLVLMSLGLLNTTIINTGSNAITFDIADLYHITKTKLRKDRFILAIKKAMESLQTKRLSILNPITKDFESHVWLPTIKGNLESHEVNLYFNPELIKMFSEIQGNYTQCLLKNVMPLKTQYAKRLYQLAMQYKPPQRKIPEIPLGQFRSMLALVDSYPDYHELNRRVIMPAIKDINKQTDILLNVVPVKTGKTVNALQFSYKFKSKEHQLQVTPITKRPVKRKAKRSRRSLVRPVQNTNQLLRPVDKLVQANLAKSGNKY